MSFKRDLYSRRHDDALACGRIALQLQHALWSNISCNFCFAGDVKIRLVGSVDTCMQALYHAVWITVASHQTSTAYTNAALQVNHPDGITSGGNQFKVNDKGVILGNVGTGGSIDVGLFKVAHEIELLSQQTEVYTDCVLQAYGSQLWIRLLRIMHHLLCGAEVLRGVKSHGRRHGTKHAPPCLTQRGAYRRLTV